MNKNNIILYFLLIYFLQSQSIVCAQDLHEKYWYYRFRFLGNETAEQPGFIFIGDEPGASIPATSRNIHVPDGFWPFEQYDPDPTPPARRNTWTGDCFQDGLKGSGRKGELLWGDATVYLGNYISVVATEWKLMYDNNKDVSRQEKELYFALKAINRLDELAETLYGETADLNGFFVRDDVPADFYEKFSPGIRDYEIVASAGACSDKVQEVLDRIDCNDSKPTELVPEIMSKDQALALLMGLRCVEHFVSSTASYNGMNLTQEAIEITTRIINYLKNSGGLTSGNWVIKDPNDDRVCRGASAAEFSFAIARAGREITDEGFQNLISGTYGVAIWDWLEGNMKNHAGESITLCFDPILGTILGNVLNNPLNPDIICGTIPLQHFVVNMILQLAAISDTWKESNLRENSNAYEMEIFDLLHSALHDITPPDNKKSHYSDILTSAPCQGPCYDDHQAYNDIDFSHSTCQPVDGWKAMDRFGKPHIKDKGDYKLNQDGTYALDDAGKIQPNKQTWGEYNGLDYMLFYNLYKLVYEKGSYADMIDRKIVTNFPLSTSSGLTFASKAHPIKLLGYNSIFIDNSKLMPDADVTLKASKEITLGDKFEVQEGANFEAIVEPITCQANKYGKKGSNELTEEEWIEINNAITPKVKQQPFTRRPKTVSDDMEYNRLVSTPKENNLFNYPNPCKDKTIINYSTITTDNVSLVIKDFFGKEIIRPVNNEKKLPGYYQFIYDVSNLNPGIYYYTLQAENFVETRKMVVVK